MTVVKQFVPDLKKTILSTSHDGAANMLRVHSFSKLIIFNTVQLMLLHLLLTVDISIIVDETVTLLHKCRDIATMLHFKSEQLADEMTAAEDKRVIANLKTKMNEVNDVIDLDDQYPVYDNDDSVKESEHHHVTLDGIHR